MTPFACTLDDRDLATRRDELRRFATQLRGRALAPRRATLRFDPAAAAAVREFVAAESRCCGFFGFEVAGDDREVVLTITAPAGAEPMLTALLSELVSGLVPRG